MTSPTMTSESVGRQSHLSGPSLIAGGVSKQEGEGEAATTGPEHGGDVESGQSSFRYGLFSPAAATRFNASSWSAH